MKELVVNPYKDVNWKNQYKANLHTHANRWATGHSELDPHEIIDLYHAHGYKILAITEHLAFVWPWEKFGRSAENLGMLAIKGAELFNYLHQTLCLFETITRTADNDVIDIYDAYDEMEINGASGILAHPRYPLYLEKYDLNWYIETYTKYPCLFGMEVFNPKYQEAETWWDKILSILMPQRPVWGVAGHDTHIIANEFDKNHTIIMADRLSETSVRYAMENGHMYFLNGETPRDVVIKNIHVDKDKGSIDITAENTQRIEWITKNGRVIEVGNSFSYKHNDALDRYIRIRAVGDNNIAYSQPFGFIDIG
ncbi:MAG: hypothetical protein GX974_01085 [Clostridiales bacterium]|nr:hypothetical protein [Clostridiales bacterium]